MKNLFRLVAVVLLFLVGCGTAEHPTTRVVEDFNFDWCFELGDKGAYADPDYNDSNWPILRSGTSCFCSGGMTECRFQFSVANRAIL